MHELLGNAANVDACAAKAPFRALGRWRHEIQHRYFGAMRDRLFGTGQTARAAANHDQIVIVVFFCNL